MLDVQPSDCSVLVTTSVPENWRVRVVQAASGGRVVITEDADEIRAALPDTTIWYARRLDEELLELGQNLEWCHVSQTGVELIPHRLLKKRRITLTNGRGLQGPAVADHIMALILAWTRNIHVAVRNQVDRRWERPVCAKLARSTILIVGLGSIGRQLARRSAGFGQRILGVAKRPRTVPYVDDVVSPSRIHDVLPEADFVVLSCPLTSDTHHLISSRELSLMRPTAYLVNVGRGGLVDETALVKALKDGAIAGAGLDVFEAEPLPGESELWGLKNVIITPHTGGSRQKAREEATLFFLENLHRYLSGRPLMNIVNLDLGY